MHLENKKLDMTIVKVVEQSMGLISKLTHEVFWRCIAKHCAEHGKLSMLKVLESLDMVSCQCLTSICHVGDQELSVDVQFYRRYVKVEEFYCYILLV